MKKALLTTAPTEPRLLAIDLDGTLLAPDGRLPARTRAAIARLRAEGVHVVLASGRAPAGMRRLCRELELTDPQITMQGALVASPLTGETLARWDLDPADVREHIAFARRVGAVPLLCTLDGFRSEVSGPEIEALFAPYDEPLPRIVPSLEAEAESGVIKSFLYTPPGLHESIWRAAEEAFGSRATVTSGDEESVELLAAGASKGAALRVLAAHLGIPLVDVAAVGDARNDIEMLREAGHSAAMVHARPEVRAAAQIVVPSNTDEGILAALDCFFPTLAPFSGA